MIKINLVIIEERNKTLKITKVTNIKIKIIKFKQ